MKTNLETFPKDESDSMEEAVYTAPYQTWKTAFEKELRKILKDKEHPSLVTDWEVAQFIREILGE